MFHPGGMKRLRRDRSLNPIVPTARFNHLSGATLPRSELLGYFRAVPAGTFSDLAIDVEIIVPHSGQVPDSLPVRS